MTENIPQDLFPQLEVPCDGCGASWGMPGRWAPVAEKLCSFGDVRMFFRCAQCHSMIYNPELDLMTGKMDFFQVILRPDNGQELFQMITYDVGNWSMLATGGNDAPEGSLVDLTGKPYTGVPGEDLTCGVCAAIGVLPYKEVKACVLAVRKAYPAQPAQPTLLV